MAIKKQIIKFDENHNEIVRYDSAREAARINNISEDKLYKIINGKRISPIDGFYYEKSGVLTNTIDYIGTGEYKCPYCKRRFETYNGLCKHVIAQKVHGDITQEELLTHVKYNGVRPRCKCGCGNYTNIVHNGGDHFANFCYGHGIRVHNNWGHNPKAITNSAETRRKQYKNGERLQWNKGKKWKDVFTEEEIVDLKNKIFTSERAKKISEYFTGRPKSKEHVQKMKEIFGSPEYREKYSKNMHDRVNNGQFSLTSSGETEFIQTIIEPMNIKYETQYYIKDIKHYCDVYIPSKNIIVEYDGDFWHCNPEKFPDGPRCQYQIDKLWKDKKENEYCEKNGIKIIRVWENDYKKHFEQVREKLKKEILNS